MSRSVKIQPRADTCRREKVAEMKRARHRLRQLAARLVADEEATANILAVSDRTNWAEPRERWLPSATSK